MNNRKTAACAAANGVGEPSTFANDKGPG